MACSLKRLRSTGCIIPDLARTLSPRWNKELFTLLPLEPSEEVQVAGVKFERHHLDYVLLHGGRGVTLQSLLEVWGMHLESICNYDRRGTLRHLQLRFKFGESHGNGTKVNQSDPLEFNHPGHAVVHPNHTYSWPKR